MRLYPVLFFLISTVVLVNCSPKPLLESFRFRNSIAKGDESTLSWSVPKATEVSIEGLEESLPNQGRLKLSPEQNQDYTFIASKNGKILVKKEFKIRVYQKNAKILSFGGPSQVASGKFIKLHWNTQNAERVWLEGLKDSLSPVGVLKVFPQEQRDYILAAQDRYGETVRDTLRVKVVYPAYFSAKRKVRKGEKNLLKWNIEKAKSVEIVGIRDSLPAQGELEVPLQYSKNYVLRARLEDGSEVEKRTYTELIPFTFGGTKSILRGNYAQLNWNTGDVLSLKIREFPNKKLPAQGQMQVFPQKNTSYHLDIISKDSSRHFLEHRVNVKPRTFVKGNLDIQKKPAGVQLGFDIFKVDYSNYPEEVKLYVLVTDTNGNFINNLAPPNISGAQSRKYFVKMVEEVEGKKYPVQNFKVEEFHRRLNSYSIGMSLDYSGSMRSYIDTLEKAVKKFIRDKNPEDELSVVKFDGEFERELDLSLSSAKILKKTFWDGLKRYGGSTALYAGADEGLISLKAAKNEKMLLLFTDGEENSSFKYFGERAVSASQLAKKARESNTRIFPIALGSGTNNELLNELAQLSGGKAYFIESHQDIREVYEEFPRILENFYVITYKAQAQPGKHRIDLTFNNGIGKLESVGTNFFTEMDFDIDRLDIKVDTSGRKIIAAPQAVAFFDFDRSSLADQYKPNLDKFVDYLKQKPSVRLQIAGHTDSVGDANYCVLLSRRRAETVRQYLIQKGISAQRIEVLAYGKTKPLWPEEDEDWKAHENRRIEIILFQ